MMKYRKHADILALWLFLSLCYYCHASYSPKDSILLDCGSSGNQTAGDGRKWTGEIGSKFAPSDKLSQASKATDQETDVEAVPYISARLSRSSFTYAFPMATSGPKFVRLYFYPASYSSGGGGDGDFAFSDPLFSVKSGPYTLLHNFSASLVADSMSRSSFTREFTFFAKETTVVLTFTPSPNSYAFVNGIEIVSMPTDLYYGRLPVFGCIKALAGSGRVVNCTLDNGTALETVYRLNVGGRTLSPGEDTGMFRSWLSDADYTTNLTFPRQDIADSIKYTKVPDYVAPSLVYASARNMGSDFSWNERNNLTWLLPVDGGFSYMLRLHFCELEEQVKLGERPFYIYIDDNLADFADVMKWGGGHHMAVYRDYLLTLKEKNGKLDDGRYALFIVLHPSDAVGTYVNVLLNGIEMFKLNDTDGNLAGPNPEPPSSPTGAPRGEAKKKSNKRIIIVAAAVSAVCSSLLVLAFLLLWRRMRGSTPKGDPSLLLPESLCRRFSLQEIKAATNNFDESLCIGKGGFGKVFRGCIVDSGKTVAIKQLGSGSRQGAREFLMEIRTLSQLRHRHLVSLVGFCNEGREKILVYEYMTNGTLDDHLYKDGPPLPWKLRLHICIGAAHGLHHLHAEAPEKIIHRDVKPANILLDKDWVAKVSDFGLSKTCPISIPDTKVETARLTGTLGYMDPEYLRCMHLTEKSDVYSFGVMLLEVLCARKAVKDEKHLPDWVETCSRDGTLHQKIDPFLMGKIDGRCFEKFVDVAMSCLQDSGISRPTMREVASGLEEALRLQEESKEMSKEEAEDHPWTATAQGSAAMADEGGSSGLDSATSGWTASVVTSGSQFGSGSTATMTSDGPPTKAKTEKD